jgi:benzylsuccinate CoA-transferase BbsF subunit
MSDQFVKSRPLDGLKVCDATWYGAGPIATRALANLGADVIRIETEKRPDGLRIAQPKPEGEESLNQSGYYNNFNAEKRSITIDLTTERGHELGIELVKWADVFATNMTARAIRKIGLNWENVQAANPGIIGLYEPMQGMTGPHSEFQGFGALLSAICGVNYLAGNENEPPIGVGTNYTDYVINPIHAAVAVMAAVRHKRRTGEGQLIDMSQLESSVSGMAGALFAWDNGQISYERLGNRVPYAAPHGAYLANETGDRPDHWVAIACMTDFQWSTLSEVMEQPELASDPRFVTLLGRKENEDELDAIVGKWVNGLNASDVMSKLQLASVPAGMVQKASEVLQDPHLTAREFYAYPEHVEAGKRAYDGPGFRLSETPHEIRRAAPLLGEHTWEICSDVLGMDGDEIGQLMAEQILY